MWPFTWKKQIVALTEKLVDLEQDYSSVAKGYKECNSLHMWVGTILNNALTLLYCVAIALVIWKFREHLDWRP